MVESIRIDRTPPAIDVQLHVWDSHRPDRPWSPRCAHPDPAEAATRRRMEQRPVTYEAMLDSMDEAGVDAAILISPAGIYGFDNRYAFDAVAAHPDRFAAVARVDHGSQTIDAEIRTLRETSGCVGVRVMAFTDEQRRDWRYGRFDAVLRSAADNDLPVCIYPPGLLRELPAVVSRYPGLTLAIDHVGLRQPPLLKEGEDGFADLEDLLAIADCPGIVVKLSGAHDLSRQPFPFADTRGPLRRIIDAFGVDRLMWGSDWTRDVARRRYRETVDYLRDSPELSAAEKKAILADSLSRVFRWRPGRRSTRSRNSPPRPGS